MLGIRDATIKSKLYGLVAFSALGLTIVLGLSLWVLHEYRVNGPVYERLTTRTAALAEFEPPVLDTAESYLNLLELSTATDPAEVQRLLQVFTRHELQFRDRAAFWSDHLFEGPTK